MTSWFEPLALSWVASGELQSKPSSVAEASGLGKWLAGLNSTGGPPTSLRSATDEDRGRRPRLQNWYFAVVLWATLMPSMEPCCDRCCAAAAAAKLRILIVTGHQHTAHHWREVTDALLAALSRDKSLDVTVGDPDSLADPKLSQYRAIIMNYCNWERPGLPEATQQNFQKYLADGGGLVIIHFSNGAFHFSLPGAEKSDWPEWRTKICRRVWDHTAGKSGHDAYGRFRVEIAAPEHPIMRGLKPFDTIDELYFSQQGTEPIELLATARSKVTGKDEPMAFIYRYGKGRVFQTVLGHAAESVRVPSVAELIVRGTEWAAGVEPRSGAVNDELPAEKQSAAPAKFLEEGRFGLALSGTPNFARAEPKPEYSGEKLTVECWARLENAKGFNILVAQQLKESAGHWELYSYAGSGELSLYLPGYDPAEIRSDAVVTDGKWHYLAAQFDGSAARLFVDGMLVREARIERKRDDVRKGPLWIGGYPPQAMGCAGRLDSVRLSRGMRTIENLPNTPFQTDDATTGLWQFDQVDKSNAVADASKLANPAIMNAPWAPTPEPLEYQAVEPQMQVVTIDRSPHESFLCVRLDTAGRLFVGAREGLFVYEPDPQGAYTAGQLLYRFPPHTWITDIEIRGDDLYLTTASALYVLPNARVARQNITPQRLIWGLPLDLHVTMHGLAWGPEGDLYFAAGDPLLNYGDFKRADHWGYWTLFGPNGEKTPYTGAGGVFRCRPDGTDIKVVARGLRGCDGLAFDRGWNLFTNDNDHESLAASYSPARLLHVTPSADFQWPRGWMAEMSPDRSDLLPVVNREMVRGVPVGQAYYDEPLFNAQLQNSLLVARWDNRTVSGYPLQPRGASFEASEQALVRGSNTARPVGVAVGRGGRVFFVLSDMQGNEGSPTYASELAMLVPAGDASNHPFDAYEVTSLATEKLFAELSNASFQRRAAAQLELTRRPKGELAGALESLRKLAPNDLAAAHLPWLVGRLATPEAFAELQKFAKSNQQVARLQAVRALAEFATGSLPETYFAELLDDHDPQVQLAAIDALTRYPGTPPRQLVDGPARSSDGYLRQASTTLLAHRGNVELFRELGQSADHARRLAAVLAAGIRLTVPPATAPLPAELPISYEHGNASFDIQYADAKIDLKQQGRVGSFTIAERWSKLPHTEEELQLVALLRDHLSDPDESVALQAAYYLGLLNDATVEPLVTASREWVVAQRLMALPATEIDHAWSIGPFSAVENDAPAGGEIEQGPIDLSAAYGDGPNSLKWHHAAANKLGSFALPSLADSTTGWHYFYCRLYTSQAQTIMLDWHSAGEVTCWLNGQKLEGKQRRLVKLAPGSGDLLVRVDAKNPEDVLSLSLRAHHKVEVILPEAVSLGQLANRLKESAGTADKPIDPEFLSKDWQKIATTGDAARGRKLFGRDALGCVKCHAITPDQVVAGGPSLAGARSRFTVAHLVESILAPSRQVAPVYRASTIVTADGKISTGLVLTEDERQLELLQTDTARKIIAKSEIEEREQQATSPMPNGLIKEPGELLDLLTYLLSDNPPAP